MEANIKKIVKRIYEFDFSNCEVQNRKEFYVDNNRGVSDFVSTFKKNDFENGIVVTPTGYKLGLFYSTNNNGEIYCPTKLNPDIVKFSFNIFGLKKGAYYRITIPCRSAGNLNIITDDRNLLVTTDAEDLLIDADLTETYDNQDLYGIFRATSNEINLLFKVGKLIISNIIIDEVELAEDKTQEESNASEVLEEGKIQLAAYGVYNLKPNIPDGYVGKYLECPRYTGKGINLYYDKINNAYLLERDNAVDILGESFNLLNYVIDINLNKTVNKDIFTSYRICEVSLEPSPNTLKQGYLAFDLVDGSGKKATMPEGRVTILIRKIY